MKNTELKLTQMLHALQVDYNRMLESRDNYRALYELALKECQDLQRTVDVCRVKLAFDASTK